MPTPCRMSVSSPIATATVSRTTATTAIPTPTPAPSRSTTASTTSARASRTILAAGRTVAFSALTVAVSLAALLVFPLYVPILIVATAAVMAVADGLPYTQFLGLLVAGSAGLLLAWIAYATLIAL